MVFAKTLLAMKKDKECCVGRKEGEDW